MRSEELLSELPTFIGRLTEIHNKCPLTRHRRRGKIKSVALEETRLVIEFEWAERTYSDSDSTVWTEDKDLSYRTHIGSYSFMPHQGGKIRMYSPTRSETITLFPPEQKKFEEEDEEAEPDRVAA